MAEAEAEEAETKFPSLCIYPPGGHFNKKRRDCQQYRLFKSLLQHHAGNFDGAETSTERAREIVSHFPGGIFYQHTDGQVVLLAEKLAVFIVSQKIRDARKCLRRKLSSKVETGAQAHAAKLDDEAGAAVKGKYYRFSKNSEGGVRGIPEYQKQVPREAPSAPFTEKPYDEDELQNEKVSFYEAPGNESESENSKNNVEHHTREVSPTHHVDAKDASFMETSAVEDMKKEFLAYIESLQSKIEQGRAIILAQKNKIRRLESLLTEQVLQNAEKPRKKHKVSHHGEIES